MINQSLKIISTLIVVWLFSQTAGLASENEQPFEEEWSGLWIRDGTKFPEFSDFNCCDSYLLIRGSFLIGAENWAGRRWGQAWGKLNIDGYKASYDDGHCIIQLEMKNGNTIVSNDNMNCGGLNVRFQGAYIRHALDKS